MKSKLSKINEPHLFNEIGEERDLEGNQMKYELGVITDIKEYSKPSSRSRGITRKFLIGKKFKVAWGCYTWSSLNENTTSEYHKVMIGELEDGRYFQVGHAKFRRLNENEL